MKKSIFVPFLPELDNLDLEKVSDVLEEKAVRQSIECVNWPEQFSYKPITVFSIARSQKYLYINYFVRGNCLLAINDKDNGPVWQDSCVEFFVQIPGEKEYLILSLIVSVQLLLLNVKVGNFARILLLTKWHK